jgi:hypothetical protein
LSGRAPSANEGIRIGNRCQDHLQAAGTTQTLAPSSLAALRGEGTRSHGFCVSMAFLTALARSTALPLPQ